MQINPKTTNFMHYFQYLTVPGHFFWSSQTSQKCLEIAELLEQ